MQMHILALLLLYSYILIHYLSPSSFPISNVLTASLVSLALSSLHRDIVSPIWGIAGTAFFWAGGKKEIIRTTRSLLRNLKAAQSSSGSSHSNFVGKR